MCTVTIVPRPDGYCAGCNRDELNTRPAAVPPSQHQVGRRAACFPGDPQGGGTWIGVNDAGLLLCLLNRTDGPRDVEAGVRSSRGLIIPPLLGHATLREAAGAARGIDPQRHEKFRLVMAHARDVCVVTSDGRSLSAEYLALDRPLMFTSSSLGDAVAEAPRRRLFDAMVCGRDASWFEAQRRFHDHQWPDRPEISVRMLRTDARTVSRSFVTVAARSIDFIYEPFVRAARVAA